MNVEKTGKFIAELRKEKQMTQRDLGEKLFITDKAVSKWERGLASPDISLLVPLAELLGVSTTELLNGERCPSFSPDFAENALIGTIEIFEETRHKEKVRLLALYSFLLLLIVLLTVILYHMHMLSNQWSSLSSDLTRVEDYFISQKYQDILDAYDGTLEYDDYLYISHTSLAVSEQLRHMNTEKITLLRNHPDILEAKNVYLKKNYLLYYTLLQSSEIFGPTVSIKPEMQDEIYSLLQENINTYNAFILAMNNAEQQYRSNIFMKLYLSLRNVYF